MSDRCLPTGEGVYADINGFTIEEQDMDPDISKMIEEYWEHKERLGYTDVFGEYSS